MLGECKWTTDRVGTGLFDDLEALEPEVRWHGTDRSVEYVLFSRSGFSDGLKTLADSRENLRLYSLDGLAELFDSETATEP